MKDPQPTGSTLWSRASRWFHAIFDLESSGDLFVYSALVGVVSACGAWLFAVILHWTVELTLHGMMGLDVVKESAGETVDAADPLSGMLWWTVLLLPVIGGLICGWLVFTYAPEAEGHGTDAMVKAFHRLQGVVRPQALVVKAIASIVTIGTGGSAGREGPIAQIGAGFGSLLATQLQLSPVYRRTLMLCGAAGGIAAIFQAPLGGALFVCEVLYASTAVEFSVVVAAVISSLTAYSVFIWICDFSQPLTGIAASRELHVSEVLQDFTVSAGEYPFFLVFAVLCAIVGFVYVKTFYGLRDKLFRKLPIPNALKPAVGGLLLGILVLSLHVPGHLPHGAPHVMGGGYYWIQKALDGDLLGNIWWVIALICAAKILATSFTVSSGGSGGVFAPSLFIGGMLGAAYGHLCHNMFPSQVAHPEVFVLVGMGGFFAGVAKVPLTAVLMVCEMTGGYQLLVPLMLVSFVNVAILSSHITLYEEQVRSLIDSPAHFGDFVIDVLAEMKVDQVFNRNRAVQLIPEEMPLSRVVRVVAASHNSHFPVVDAEQRMVGIFSLSDIRAAFEGGADDALILAQDIAVFPVITVTPDDDLHTALRRCTQKNIDEIPVVDPEDSQRVLGMLRRKELIAAYSQRMSDLRKAD